MDQNPRFRDPIAHPTENIRPDNPSVPSPRLPPAPPMQIVTKGWWWRPDEETTADELVRAGHEQ